MIALLDYGSGNLRSAERAFAHAGAEVLVTSDPEVCKDASALVVPGVGAFGACVTQLRRAGGEEIISKAVAAGKPLFGICVGMQILFSAGIEKGLHTGLALFDSTVESLEAPVLPHIGWNTLEAAEDSKFYKGVEDSHFYFVHSYAANSSPENAISVWSNYGNDFVASIERDNIFATQFHPEKSGEAGLRLIKNWVESL